MYQSYFSRKSYIVEMIGMTATSFKDYVFGSNLTKGGGEGIEIQNL